MRDNVRGRVRIVVKEVMANGERILPRRTGFGGSITVQRR